MNLWEPFTERARRAVVLAQEEAQFMGCAFTGTEHLLLGILSEGEGAAAKACIQHGITLNAARDVVRTLGNYHGTATQSVSGLTARCRKVVEMAHDIANERGENYVGTETLFIAIFKEGDGLGARALVELGFGDILASMSAGELTS